MNKEEQEAIKIIQEYLKTSIANEQGNDFFKDGGWEVIDMEIAVSIKTLMNYISKLQKENEELKNADLTSVYINGFYDGESKWKTKIKDKLNKLQKQQIREIEETDMSLLSVPIRILESLLKEN